MTRKSPLQSVKIRSLQYVCLLVVMLARALHGVIPALCLHPSGSWRSRVPIRRQVHRELDPCPTQDDRLWVKTAVWLSCVLCSCFAEDRSLEGLMYTPAHTVYSCIYSTSADIPWYAYLDASGTLRLREVRGSGSPSLVEHRVEDRRPVPEQDVGRGRLCPEAVRALQREWIQAVYHGMHRIRSNTATSAL